MTRIQRCKEASANARVARRDDRSVAKAPQLRDESGLFVCIDGAVSRRRLDSNTRPEGPCHHVVMRFLSSAADIHLLDLHERSELVWCSGWEEKADEHLPYGLCLPGAVRFLSSRRDPGRSHGRRGLAAIAAGAIGARPR